MTNKQNHKSNHDYNRDYICLETSSENKPHLHGSM